MVKSKQIEIKTKINIDEMELSSIFDAAFHGMTYWAEGMYPVCYGSLNKEELEKEKLSDSQEYARIILNGGSLEVIEHEHSNSKKHEFNLENIASGLEVLSLKYPHLIDLSDIGGMDSNSSEFLIQCALFGNIIYG